MCAHNTHTHTHTHTQFTILKCTQSVQKVWYTYIIYYTHIHCVYTAPAILNAPTCLCISYVQRMQVMFGIDTPLSSLLIKPVQRITKYPLLLRVCVCVCISSTIIIPCYFRGYTYVVLQYTALYRRTGFKCEHVIIANCDFSPSTQLLEHNVYITYSINQYVARA